MVESFLILSKNTIRLSADSLIVFENYHIVFLNFFEKKGYCSLYH
ncbi:hypothetical protein FHS60_001753 [Alloprevotella rava]|uniref:Uncharacterized protein n=1 Tax=Alloprevotella rava TaxID=671218 RepID=A0A7W5UKP5_9BACT|nr:hypothetical protein [Alloprevotella rava]